MSVAKTREPQVLIVEDEEEVADLYEFHLEDEFDVVQANSGEEAIETVDESVDIVLLDRRMPGMNGDEVLEQIREDRLGCRVIMVTAVTPEADIAEMDFDDYLNKPVRKDTLIEAVEHQLTVRKYGEAYRELNKACSKLNALKSDSGKTADELEELPLYTELQEQIERLKAEQEELLDELDYFEAASAW
mgnify:CR=1 FL=1